MAHEDNQSIENGSEKAEFSPLDFSFPQCRYESTARLTNSQGQQFIIRVNGFNKAAVEKYSRELRIYFNVLSDTSTLPLQQDESEPKGDRTNPEFSSNQNLDLNLDIEVIGSGDIPPVFETIFPLEFSVEQGELLKFRSEITKKISINISVAGTIKAELVRLRDGKLVDKAELNTFQNPLKTDGASQFCKNTRMRSLG